MTERRDVQLIAARLDAEARVHALDPQRSIVLQAPAGSGKTAVLTQRFLRLLSRVEEPEQILAITFTRKAAAEMRERVVRALRGDIDARAAGGAQLNELAAAARAHAHARGWSLEAHPGRLRIQTIDSLNRFLASRLPIAARSAGDLAVAEQPEGLYRAAARRALTDAESDPGLQADAELLFERLDNDYARCERLLTEMLQRRSQWLPHLLEGSADALSARVEASLHALSAERSSAAQRLIPVALLAEAAALARAAAQHRQYEADCRPGPWQAWLGPATALSGLTLEHWQGLAQLALTEHGSWRLTLTRRQGFPPEDAPLKQRGLHVIAALGDLPGARELLGEIAMLPPVRLAPEDALALAALARLLKLAASELQLIFDQHSRVDYAHVGAAARRALTEEGAPTELGLRLGEQIRHLLVDEFQDTSLEQCALLEALTAGWEPGDGRTLFVVGDPMQSIYQFREAEVGLFLRTRTHGLGALRLEPLALTRNFRAAPALIEWLNRVFPACFPERDDPRSSAVRYTECVAGRAPQSPGAVQLHRTAPGDVAGEAREIARLVRKLRARAAAASIAILLTARTHAGPIVAALRSAGVPVAGVELVSLAELSIVRDLAALTCALDHLADRTAWLAVLRAPWCGLSLAELSVLSARGTATVWEALSDESAVAALGPPARARVARVRGVLAAALAERDRTSLARWVELTWLRLGGPAACAGDEDLEHAQAFFRALERWAAEPDWSGPRSLEGLLERLYAVHAAPAAAAVQIMTIHHAKGLEFDHVILPGLGRKLRATTEPLLRWLALPREPRGDDLLLAPIPPPWRRGAEPLNEYLKSLQARRAAHERARLLYVAATRARRELHLFCEPAPAAAQRPSAPHAGTPLATLWRAIAADFPAEKARPAAPQLALELPPPQPLLARLTADWSLPQPAPGPHAIGIAIASYEARGAETERAAVLAPADYAFRAVCEQLRRYARRGQLPAPSAPELASELRERLERTGLDTSELADCARLAQAALAACLADSRLQWIFSPRHTRTPGTLELTGLHEGRLTSMRGDCTFIDATGARWLIDFVAATTPEESAAEFLAGQMAQRSGEHAKYLALARQLGEVPVRVGCYFVSQQAFCEYAGKR